jgi:putative tricarboxylic transport membrane protein
MKAPDIVGGAIGMAIGSYVLIEGAKMPEDHIMKIGPSFFPNVLAIVLIGFSAFLILQGALSRKDGSFDSIDFRAAGVQRALLTLCTALGYAFFLKTVGFLPCTALFILILMLLLGSRKLLELILTPLIATTGVWFVFERLLMISLPAGLMSMIGF